MMLIYLGIDLIFLRVDKLEAWYRKNKFFLTFFSKKKSFYQINSLFNDAESVGV